MNLTAPRDLAIFEQAAVAAARAGGEILRHRFRETVRADVATKGLHDYVTETVRAAEAAVVGFLKKCFPEHGILAEEGTRDESSDRHRWIVDPLDGTTNFIHGVPTFAVSVALEGPEGLVAGAIYDPVHDEAFSAAAGLGARLNGRAIACRDPGSLDESLIATGFPFRELSRLDRYLVAFERFVRGTSGIRRAGSRRSTSPSRRAAATTAFGRSASPPGTSPRGRSSSARPAGSSPTSAAGTHS